MKNNQKKPVNYIQHLTGFYDLIAKDNRLTSAHVSLYMALFQFWNLNRFHNPISISRNEMMQISKIGSTNTYTKCLKELDAYGYIQYAPSFNPLKGSTVNLFDFDKGTNDSCGNGSDKASKQGVEMLLRPSINNTNITKQINNKKIEKGNSQSELPSHSKNEDFKNQKMNIPDLQEIQSYFLEKENTTTEAERFLNYYESNGWLVGGKTKMKDWKAAARNWMINTKRFEKSEQKTSSHLHVDENKRYDIPL